MDDVLSEHFINNGLKSSAKNTTKKLNENRTTLFDVEMESHLYFERREHNQVGINKTN